MCVPEDARRRRWMSVAMVPAPAVVTWAPGLYLAGDWVRRPFPTALMERAASGVFAANQVLDRAGAAFEPVRYDSAACLAGWWGGRPSAIDIDAGSVAVRSGSKRRAAGGGEGGQCGRHRRGESGQVGHQLWVGAQSDVDASLVRG